MAYLRLKNLFEIIDINRIRLFKKFSMLLFDFNWAPKHLSALTPK